MRQLPLDLQLPAPASFDDFLIGPNLEAFLALKALADRESLEGCIYLWGAAGLGKSHLLLATVRRSQQNGFSARYINAVDAALSESDHGFDLLAVDHVEALDAQGQIALFGLINAQRELGRAIVTAGSLPPLVMSVREDLRTRLGWGWVFDIAPPDDADKATLLRHRAHARGCDVDEALCRWLVTHQSRDLAALTALLDALDRAALAAKRPLTLPFVKTVLQDPAGLM